MLYKLGNNEPVLKGEGTNIQDGCTGHLDRDKPLIVGRQVTVGHKSVLHGCTIGDNCLIGMGLLSCPVQVSGKTALLAPVHLLPRP